MMERKPSTAQEALMERQILLAAMVALALAATVKVVAPVENAALAEAVRTHIPPVTLVHSHPMWLR
jgi:hypothetical protein